MSQFKLSKPSRQSAWQVEGGAYRSAHRNGSKRQGPLRKSKSRTGQLTVHYWQYQRSRRSRDRSILARPGPGLATEGA